MEYSRICSFSKYELLIPKYNVVTPLNSFIDEVSMSLDESIRDNFNGDIALRAISISEHKRTLNELIQDIEKYGTDRVDPFMGGRKYNSQDEIYAGLHNTYEKYSMSRYYIQMFYEKSIKYNKSPRKIDLFLVYDPKCLITDIKKPTRHRFKFPNRKIESLNGIIVLK